MTDATVPPKSRRWRITALLAFTVLLHLWIINWGAKYFNAAPTDDSAAQSVSVVLRPLPLPALPVSLPVATPRKPPRIHKQAAPKPALAPLPSPVETTEAATTSLAAAADPAAQTSAADAVADPAADTATAPTSDEPAAPAIEEQSSTDAKQDVPASQGTHYQVDPPPSAQLEYDVHATYNNMAVHGSGIIAWQTDGAHFTINGKAEDFLFTFLTFVSTGDINEFGVAPELYTEKKIRRAATNTHFNRERNVISFSASTTTYPRVGGEQDRASLIWQLVGIGRGDSGKFAPGAVIDMFVAGVRDGEVWRMQIIGQEEIKVPTGKFQAWHVVRQPRPGSYDQQLDIWLAPDQQWYPVRLRFTETNGDYLEMSLSKLKTL